MTTNAELVAALDGTPAQRRKALIEALTAEAREQLTGQDADATASEKSLEAVAVVAVAETALSLVESLEKLTRPKISAKKATARKIAAKR